MKRQKIITLSAVLAILLTSTCFATETTWEPDNQYTPISYDDSTYVVILPATGGSYAVEVRPEEGQGIMIDCQDTVTELVIPEEVDGYPLTIIDRDTFDNTAIQSITLPSTWTTIDATLIDTSTSQLIIPEGVVSISDYGDAWVGGKFMNNHQLTYVALPSTLTYVGAFAFTGCENLKGVYIPPTVEEVAEGAFGCDYQVTFHGQVFMAVPYDDFTVYGEPNTAAEAYAARYGFTFVTDTPSDWAIDDVDMTIELGILPVSLQGNYQATTTRAEFAEMAVHYLAAKADMAVADFVDSIEGEGVAFTDIAHLENDVQEMIGVAYALGITQGRSEGIFDPDTEINRQEAATMLLRCEPDLATTSSMTDIYTDWADISDWATDAITAMYDGGIMNGIGEDVFAPMNGYTRQQCAVTFARLWNLNALLP